MGDRPEDESYFRKYEAEESLGLKKKRNSKSCLPYLPPAREKNEEGAKILVVKRKKKKPHSIHPAPPPSQCVCVYKKNISPSQPTNKAVVYICACVCDVEKRRLGAGGCCVYVHTGGGGMVDAERKPRISSKNERLVHSSIFKEENVRATHAAPAGSTTTPAAPQFPSLSPLHLSENFCHLA